MLTIDCAFPGGNILIDRIEGDAAWIRQDLRDTAGPWFWWCFRVTGGAGRTLRFAFTDGDVIGVRGPACSLDGGRNWLWLGRECVHGSSFSLSLPEGCCEARLAFGIPYLQADFQTFLAGKAGSPLEATTLCRSRKDRPVELLRLQPPESACRWRLLFAARHHCCESMAGYAMEGLVDAALGRDETGRWFQEEAACTFLPFVDKDGVEDGDQGKNRKPRDHGRDYADESLYPETRTIRARLLEPEATRPHVVIDLHCPWIRGEYNEEIYFVGDDKAENWARVQRLSAILESMRSGPLPYRQAANLPFGRAWNTKANYKEGRGLSSFARDLPGVHLASSIEIPYANAGGVEATPAACRAFGRDLAVALASYLRSEC